MAGRKRVVVAMSGGVDSSVAAALLAKQRYDVTGVMLRMWSEPDLGAGDLTRTPQAVAEARRVADVLGIPFYVLDCEQRFKECVVRRFIDAYARGDTPNPCLACNRHIKFGFLLQTALAHGADYVATGHYARNVQVDGEFQLRRGADVRKDQSYFLYMLRQDDLSRLLFPLGGLTKATVREMAARIGLPVAAKEESQDICFVRGGDYRRFLLAHAPEIARPGPIVDSAGRELGRHTGLPFYTIGQRHGIGVSAPAPLYVRHIDVARNALIVGPAAELGRSELRVVETRFVSGRAPRAPVAATVKVRYTGREVEAILEPQADGAAQVRLRAPVRDVTPGQAAVFYQGDRVLGGGTIAGAPELD